MATPTRQLIGCQGEEATLGGEQQQSIGRLCLDREFAGIPLLIALLGGGNIVALDGPYP